LIERAIEAEHHLLGVDRDDPQITATRPFRIRPYLIDEDSTGNPFHLLFVIFTCGWVGLAALRRREDTLVLVYTTAVVTGYVLFCASIKWQPFHPRLDLPLFVAAAPVVGLALARIARERVTFIIGLLLLLLSLPPLLSNPSHPLIGESNIFNLDRESEYFLNRPQLAAPYIQSADFLASRQCNSIGLALERDDYEYPLWILMYNRLGRWPRIQIMPIGRTPEAWQATNCVVIPQPQLRDSVFAWQPSGLWEVRIFGSVTVLTRR
jgi:hypothetical protein